MYVFRLGVISTLLSETFVNGFTTGAAIHVLVSQFPDLLGVKLPKRKGYFKIVYVRGTKNRRSHFFNYGKQFLDINLINFLISDDCRLI